MLCKYKIVGAHGPSTVMLEIIHDVFISSSVKLGRAAVTVLRGVCKFEICLLKGE